MSVLVLSGALLCVAAFAFPARIVIIRDAIQPSVPLSPRSETRLGINLFGLATYNRQQVFTNLISQSEWFSSQEQGWTIMSPDQLDARGWVRFLRPGQTAPRPLVLPPAPFGHAVVRCVFEGRGQIEVGGVARLRDRGDHALIMDLESTGAPDEGAWIELVKTDPSDPVRGIDCRETGRPRDERFHPEFLAFVKNFQIIRFLDWQRTNDNAAVRWSDRTLPENASQVGAAGASVEDMIDLANRTGADPWFLMPYRADATYVREFARLVHDRLDPHRTVYIELGNEIWNDMFEAAQQARREGLALKLGNGDPTKAQAIRYAQRLREVMRIWTEMFADRPDGLVRVAASQNANPDLASIILGHADTADWVDALATAPYVWLDLEGRDAKDVDWVFAQMPRAIDGAIDFADRNRSIAASHGKRFIAYEGGQHLVTADLALARAIQRDRRMGAVYDRYLDQWNDRIRSELTLYASTAPIAEYGSWGLREYAGQPLSETPKLQAVRRFLARRP